MKVFFSLFLALGLATGVMAQEPVLPASEIMNTAYAQAAKENKQVFVIFHASWCSWCHRMDSLMNVAETKPLFDKNFVVVHLVVQESKNKKNLENPGAAELKDKNNGQNEGIPFWLIFDTKGKLLGDSRMPATDKKTGKVIMTNTGCPADPAEVEYFTGLLKKTTTLTDSELSVIAKKFARTQPGH